MDKCESAQARRRQGEFTHLAALAARKGTRPEPTEDEIVQATNVTREAIFRERYGSE